MSDRPIYLARRDLFKAALVGAGVAFLPTMALPRRARADLRTGYPAKRLVICNQTGGIRSSAAFHAANGDKHLNPYDLMPNVPATELRLGAFLDDYLPMLGEPTPLTDAEYTLPGAWNNVRTWRLREIADKFSVVCTYDSARGDHILERTKAPTGSGGGDQPGILTRVAAGLSETLHLDQLEFPTFHIEPNATFGRAADFARYVPVTLAGPRSLPGAGDGALDMAEIARLTGHDWARDGGYRYRFDAALSKKRAKAGKDLVDVFSVHRKAAHDVGGTLAQPYVNVASPDTRTVAYGKVDVSPAGDGSRLVDLTNQMLYDVFTKALGPGDPTHHPSFNTAMNAAIVVRLLQLRCRALCFEMGNFDYHSGERGGRSLYAFMGRLWATFNWLLRRIPDPDEPSKSLYRTTLMVTMSDFGRDPGPSPSGYNGGEGTDHGSHPACYTLAHAMQGAGVPGGRLFSKVDTTTYRGDQAPDGSFGERQLLAMMLWALGLDHANPRWGFDDVVDPIKRVWG